MYYACFPRAKNANGLATFAAKGNVAPIRDFIQGHIDKANVLNASKMIISAESLYAMTTFFHKFNGRGQDYWRSEANAIKLLNSAIPPEMPKKLIVFFRRPDHFLESIYRQLIGSTALAMPIHEFKSLMREALDYSSHMAAWRTVFPDCVIYTYEEGSNNISRFFLRNAIQVANVEGFKGLDSRSKSRWSREILEYKRLLNSMDMSSVNRQMNRFTCDQLARTLSDDGKHQEHLAPDARVELLRELDCGNTHLSDRFGMKPFPGLSVEDLQGWAPYPGLSPDRLREFRKCHARIRRSAHYRVEQWAQLLRYFILHRLSMIAWIMLPLGRFLLSPHKRKMLNDAFGPRKR
jgi:hypothetical protein